MRVIPIVIVERGTNRTERGLVQQQQQGSAALRSVGVLSRGHHAMSSSHRIASHHISLSREGTSKSPSHSHSPACPYLYPSAILGHAPPPVLPCLAPACLNFPYLAQLHKAQHNSHLSPDLRHGASQALKATTPRCSDSCSTAHKRFALPSSLAVPRPKRIFPRDLERGCSTLHSWPSGKPSASL